MWKKRRIDLNKKKSEKGGLAKKPVEIEAQKSK